jgi:hypothetical protein
VPPQQPLHRRGRQQQRLLWIPGPEGFGLAHARFSRPDPLQSLGSGQIQSRLWRTSRRGAVCDRLLKATPQPPWGQGCLNDDLLSS